jgi:hypothetical protein
MAGITTALLGAPSTLMSPPPLFGALRARLWAHHVHMVAAAVTVALAATVAGPIHPVRAGDFAAAGKLPNLRPADRIWSVAFNPGDPTVALAGTDNGIYRSADQGANWDLTTITGTRVWQVGFDPRPGNVAYAALAGRGVQRSDDGGKTWTDASQGLGNPNVRVMAFGVDGIAAGTADGLSVSTDGKQWRGAGLAGYSVDALAVAANMPEFTLIAGVDHGDTAKGYLFRTTNGGVTPEVLKDGLPDTAVVSSIAAGPMPQSATKRPLVMTSDTGTYHSIDGGTTWALSGGIPTQPTTIRLTCSAFSGLDPNLVYIASDAGGSTGGSLMRSVDGGATFAAFEAGLPKARNAESIAVASYAQPVVLAAMDPPGAPASIFRAVDTAAPAPAPINPEAPGAPIPAVVPTAAPTPPPAAVARPAAPAPPSKGGLGTLVNWPMPLSIELLALLAVAYGVIRWRQRYLDVEGPP